MPAFRKAFARLARVIERGHQVGPCQMPECGERATVIVEWDIAGFGTTRAFYCDAHAPEEAIEA